jgi:hypothetical protein
VHQVQELPDQQQPLPDQLPPCHAATPTITPNEIPRVLLPTLLVDKHHLPHEHHVFLTMVAKIPYVVPTKSTLTTIWHYIYRRQKNGWQRNAAETREKSRNFPIW